MKRVSIRLMTALLQCDLGRQASLKESSKSKELAELRLHVLVVVKANDACESKKDIISLRFYLKVIFCLHVRSMRIA